MYFSPFASASFLDFEQVNVCWDYVKNSIYIDHVLVIFYITSSLCLCCFYLYWQNITAEMHFFCTVFKSSHRRCSLRKTVLKNLGEFTEKHLYRGLFFNKVAGFIKKGTRTQVFSNEFNEICSNTFFTISGRRLLCFRIM